MSSQSQISKNPNGMNEHQRVQYYKNPMNNAKIKHKTK